MLDLTNVDAESGYHNWIEAQRLAHTPEREQAFHAGWRIISDFIDGPEQKAVDWSVVCGAVHDAVDYDGINLAALEHSFASNGLLVVHRGEGAVPSIATVSTATRIEARSDLNVRWVICLFRGHVWNAKGPHNGDYCSVCGQWEYDR